VGAFAPIFLAVIRRPRCKSPNTTINQNHHFSQKRKTRNKESRSISSKTPPQKEGINKNKQEL